MIRRAPENVSVSREVMLPISAWVRSASDLQPYAQLPQRGDGQRADRQHDQRHRPVEVEHDRRPGRRRSRVSLTRATSAVWAAVLDGAEVVGEARDEPARGLAGEAREVGVHEVGERGLLHVGHHAGDRRAWPWSGADRGRGRGQAVIADHGDQHPRQDRAAGRQQRVERLLDDERDSPPWRPQAPRSSTGPAAIVRRRGHIQSLAKRRSRSRALSGGRALPDLVVLGSAAVAQGPSVRRVRCANAAVYYQPGAATLPAATRRIALTRAKVSRCWVAAPSASGSSRRCMCTMK